MAGLERHLGVGGGLIESSPETHVARSLVWSCMEVTVRIMSTTNRDQTLAKEFCSAYCKPVTLAFPLGAADPQTQETAPQFEDVLAAARPNVNNEETQKVEEFIIE
jgi:hypothetical protein